MSDFHDAARNGLSTAELETVLRQVGAERYHNRHPYHHRMTSGDLSKGELQAWALNRYCYQAVIPRKDAMILARAEDPAFRAEWRKLSQHATLVLFTLGVLPMGASLLLGMEVVRLLFNTHGEHPSVFLRVVDTSRIAAHNNCAVGC